MRCDVGCRVTRAMLMARGRVLRVYIHAGTGEAYACAGFAALRVCIEACSSICDPKLIGHAKTMSYIPGKYQILI